MGCDFFLKKNLAFSNNGKKENQIQNSLHLSGGCYKQSYTTIDLLTAIESCLISGKMWLNIREHRDIGASIFTSLSLCWADAGDVTNETDRKMWEICRRLNGDESYKFPSEDN